MYIYRERKYYTSQSKVLHTLLNVTSEVSIDKIVLKSTRFYLIYIYIYLYTLNLFTQSKREIYSEGISQSYI